MSSWTTNGVSCDQQVNLLQLFELGTISHACLKPLGRVRTFRQGVSAPTVSEKSYFL